MGSSPYEIVVLVGNSWALFLSGGELSPGSCRRTRLVVTDLQEVIILKNMLIWNSVSFFFWGGGVLPLSIESRKGCSIDKLALNRHVKTSVVRGKFHVNKSIMAIVNRFCRRSNQSVLVRECDYSHHVIDLKRSVGLFFLALVLKTTVCYSFLSSSEKNVNDLTFRTALLFLRLSERVLFSDNDVPNISFCEVY